MSFNLVGWLNGPNRAQMNPLAASQRSQPAASQPASSQPASSQPASQQPAGHQAARESLSGLQLVASRLIRLEGWQIAVLQAYQTDRIADCSPCRLVSCSKQHVFCFLLAPANRPFTTHLALTLSPGRSLEYHLRRPLVGHQAARADVSGLQLVVSRLIRLEGLQIAVLQAYQADRIADCSPAGLSG